MTRCNHRTWRRGPVSHGDRYGGWHDQRQTNGAYVTSHTTSTQDTSFGPTCRLVSSPEVGPGATVGTLKQGYPLLQ
jgi:hypothetical protein